MEGDTKRGTGCCDRPGETAASANDMYERVGRWMDSAAALGINLDDLQLYLGSGDEGGKRFPGILEEVRTCEDRSDETSIAALRKDVEALRKEWDSLWESRDLERGVWVEVKNNSGVRVESARLAKYNPDRRYIQLFDADGRFIAGVHDVTQWGAIAKPSE